MKRQKLASEVIKVSERDFERQVKDLSKLFGFLYYHTWRSIHSPAGFPDCTMVRGNRVIFAELKSEKGEPSDKQLEWINALSDVGGNVECYLWRPSNLEAIAEILRQ